MRGFAASGVVFLSFFSFTNPHQASSQAVFVGVGPTFPTGYYNDFGDNDGAKPGWMAGVGVIFPVNESGLHAFVNGLYGSNSHEYEGDKANLFGGFGGIEYIFAEEGEAGPFVFGEVGFLKHSSKSEEHSVNEGSRAGLAFGGGAGYSFPLGGMNGWVLGQYIQGQTSDDETGEGNTTFLGLMAGVSFPIG